MKISNILIIGLFFLTIFSGCQKDKTTVSQTTESYSSDVVLDWIALTLVLTEETQGYTPPVAARVYGYSGLALYESVRHGMPEYQSLEGQLSDFATGTVPNINTKKDYHWGAVANATLATFLRSCFKTTFYSNQQLINDLEEKYLTQFQTEASDDIINRSVEYGKEVATKILEYANTDGQELCYDNNFPSSYNVPIGTGFWEPTSKHFPIPLQPYWGDVRPFIKENGNILPTPPPSFSTDTNSQFYKEAYEVYEVVQNLTPEQKDIAEFWSDDPGNTATPPGHSYSIMMQVLDQENADLARTAEVYAKLGMGIHDAFVSCWKAKYHYNLIRPITYIHRHIDPEWTIPLATPPFPEYTSGHSVQSGATAQILTDLFGENYAFTDSTHAHRSDIDGSPRSFSSFFEFADEAAISRLYGGIHYRTGIYVGVDQGIQVGKNIRTLKFK